MADQLIIRGAREHNLKDVSLDLPRDSLIVFTGLSGLGQVEPRLRHDLRRGPAPLRRVAVGVRPAVPRPDGQARRRLHRGAVPGGLDRPEVDVEEPALDGRHDHRGLRLPPAALRPRRPSALPDLRRADQPADAAADRRPRSCSSRRAPASRCSRRSSAAARGSTSTSSGSCRPRASPGCGSTARPTRWPSRPTLDKQKKHTIEVVVDRLAAKPTSKRRLTDSVETALGLAGGLVVFDFVDLAENDPRPRAEVLRADGLPQRAPDRDRRARAAVVLVQLARSAPAPSATASAPGWRSTRSWSSPTRPGTLGEGVVAPWSGAHVSDFFHRLLERARRGARLRPRHAVGGPARRRRGSRSSTATRPRCTSGTATATAASAPTTPPSRASGPTSSAGTARRSPTPAGSGSRASCARCRARSASGTRLKPVSIGGDDRRQRTSPRSARCRSTRPRSSCATVELSARERQIAERVLKEIQERLRFLLDVGLDYLSLNRPAGSLSGGEAQRIRLATQIGAGLVGVLYVLDEPSIGLHQRDNHRLIETLRPAARPRQHPHRRRARRGHHPGRRLGRRHRPGRRRARRPGRALRDRSRTCSATPTPRPGSTSRAASRSRCPTYAGRARRAAS